MTLTEKINFEPCYERKLELVSPVLKKLLLGRTSNIQDIEDLVQKTLIILVEKKDSYNAQKSFSAWAKTIALYQFKAYLLKSKRKKEFNNNYITNVKVEETSPYDFLDAKERLCQRKNILNKISENHLSKRELQFLQLYLDNLGKTHVIDNMKLTKPEQYFVWKRRVVEKVKLHSPSYLET